MRPVRVACKVVRVLRRSFRAIWVELRPVRVACKVVQVPVGVSVPFGSRCDQFKWRARSSECPVRFFVLVGSRSGQFKWRTKLPDCRLPADIFDNYVKPCGAVRESSTRRGCSKSNATRPAAILQGQELFPPSSQWLACIAFAASAAVTRSLQSDFKAFDDLLPKKTIQGVVASCVQTNEDVQATVAYA
jgi:hypothetical protein